MYFCNVLCKRDNTYPSFFFAGIWRGYVLYYILTFLRYGMAYFEARILRNQAPALFNSSSRLLILSMQVFTRV